MNTNWTPRASKNFEIIIQWLSTHWTNKELTNFIEQTELIIKQIEQNPYMFQSSKKNKNVRKAHINRLVSMFYKIYPQKKQIDILPLWDNRQSPKNNQYN